MEIRELMYPPIVVKPYASVLEVAKLMDEGNAGAVLVDRGDKDFGIVTERDILYKVVSKNKDFLQTKAEEIMSIELRTIEAQRDVRRACQLFNLYDIRRLPVVDKGTIVGILDNKDVARYNIFLYDESIQILSETCKEHARSLECKVSQIMHDAIIENPETSVLDSSKLMKEKGVGEVIVEVAEGKYGIATERDVLKKVVAKALPPEDVMIGIIHTPLHTSIEPQKSIRDASRLFNIRNIRRLPIIDRGRVVGIISEKDISKFCVFTFTTMLNALSNNNL
jgi:CBS domain-containing protein